MDSTYKMGLSRTTALLALSLTFPLDHFFFLLRGESATRPGVQGLQCLPSKSSDRYLASKSMLVLLLLAILLASPSLPPSSEHRQSRIEREIKE